MSDLLDSVLSYEPVVSGVQVPLLSPIIITLSGVNYDDESLEEGFFVEGPWGAQVCNQEGLMLEYPEGIPSEPVRDILDTDYNLATPIEGTITVAKATNTTVTFNATYPFAANTNYRANLTGVLNATSGDIDGFVTWPWTTGTGSIEELPANISTSILATSTQGAAGALAQTALRVVKTTPIDHGIQQTPCLTEIQIEFNKPINSSSISSGAISIVTTATTDHPSASISVSGELYKSVEVSGKIVTLKI